MKVQPEDHTDGVLLPFPQSVPGEGRGKCKYRSVSTGVQVESQVCKSDIVLSSDILLSFPQLLHGECEFQVL